LSEDEKKKKYYYYYGGKEKKAGEIKKSEGEAIAPFSEFQQDFDRMMDRFHREFEDFWGTPRSWRHGMRWRRGFPMMPFEEKMAIPSMDLEDRGNDFRLAVDLPGFSKGDVDVEVTDDSVTVKAKKSKSEEEKKGNYVRQERTAQTFYRRVQLPEDVRSDDAKANLNNGVLEIVLPKKEPKEVKKLSVD
jgi:HSP20 family protein